MSDILNDGQVVAGSRDLSIAGGAVYATDDFKYDTQSNQILRTDKNMVPSGRKVTRGETTGTATLQLATSSTPMPPLFGQFTEAEGVHYLTHVGRSETKGGETKVAVTFAKAITGSIATA